MILLGPVVAPGFDQGDAAFVFRRADFAGQGVADFLEAGEVPKIWKLAALLRLDGLDGAAFAFQKNTRAVWLLHEREALPINAQPGELLDEIGFAQAFERREPRDLCFGQTHLPRPPTTGRATLAFEEDGHTKKFSLRFLNSTLPQIKMI